MSPPNDRPTEPGARAPQDAAKSAASINHSSSSSPSAAPRSAAADSPGHPLQRRRGFLIAGGLLTGGLVLGVGAGAARAPSAAARQGQRQSFQPRGNEVGLNAWVKITPDDRVIVAVPRAEMGQGIHTALAMLVAEEMDADWSRVSTEAAPMARVYANAALMLNMVPLQPDDDSLLARMARGSLQRLGYSLSLQVTGGSSSVRDAWEPMRLAGATARAMLVDAAAARWQVAARECEVATGVVRHTASGRQARFGELAADCAQIEPRSEVPLKDPARYQCIGQPTPRLDIPAKVRGQAEFGIDVRPAGLVHAAIRQCPVFGGRVAQADLASVLRRPGVKDAFRLGDDAVVVVANSHWRARQALAAMRITWDEGPHAQLDSAQIRAQLQQQLANDTGTGFRGDGDAPRVLARARQRLDALYEAPFLAHTAMEPVNCTAQFKDGQLTLWCATQVPSLARWKAAQVAQIDTEQVQLHLPYLGGGFGRRLETDMVTQATAIALRTHGQPVKLLWSREEDVQHDTYRPVAMASFSASLGPDGLPEAWDNRVAAPSISLGTLERLAPPLAVDAPDKNQIEGAFDLPYAIPHLRVRQLRVKTPVPVGSWRSVGHSYNAFFTESFIDELAHAALQDPLAYRLALLAHKPRHQAVLALAAQQAAWGQPLPAGVARGLAVHESFGSVCAQVAEVRLVDGAPRVLRVVCAIDCGIVVNPDTVRAQMEGAIVYGLSAALYGEITIKNGRVEQSNFPNYDAVRLATMPNIEVHLVRNTHAPGGVGEPGTPPIAPAVANALFALTGQRLRRLPLKATDWKA